MNDWSIRKQRFEFEFARVRRTGAPAIVRKAALKIAGILAWLLLLPMTAIFHLAGFRRVTVFTDRIGHLAIEPDCLLKEQALGRIAARKWVLLAPRHRMANEHLLAYWAPHFLVLRSPLACFLAGSMSLWGLARRDIAHYTRAIGRTQAAYRINRDWGERPPLLCLSPDDLAWGGTMLAGLGLPADAWFVCVHAREGGFSPVDEELHRHRNSDIEKCIPAIEEIVGRGGWVIRIGDPTMKRLPSMPQVVDYAHHRLKSARLDVILCARARFILGNTSGIALVGSVFGVPCALANMVPMSAMGLGRQDISIPMRYWANRERAYLQVPAEFSLRFSRLQHSPSFDDAGIQPEENSAEEIRELAVEMLDRLAGVFIESEEIRRRQAHFLALLADGDYSFGTVSRLGAGFLARVSGRVDAPG